MLTADKITLQGQLFGRNMRSRAVDGKKREDVLEWMIDGLSIRSGGGGVSNLTWSDLARVRGRQVLDEGVR